LARISHEDRDVGSPVTFSGFNQIDFRLILNAIMEAERAPLRTLENRQRALETQNTAFGTLATRLAALENAAASLASSTGVGGRTVASSDAAAVGVSATSTAALGVYDVVVQELARAQVTATTSAHADRDTTVVAGGGTLVIGGSTVTITGDVTLDGLAAAINAAGTDVTATVVKSSGGNYKMVLTGKDTGAAAAITIQNNLTGGSGVAFNDDDSDGLSGDSAADNAVSATDAQLLVNNVTVTGSTNVIEDAIAGVTLTALKKDPAATITVTVTKDPEVLKTSVRSFIGAYNDLVTFADAQSTGASTVDTGQIGRDPLLRGLMRELSRVLNEIRDVGGAYGTLAEIGIGFTQTGELELDEVVFDEAVEDAEADVTALFAGGNGVDGVFEAIDTSLGTYTQAGGLLADARDRLTDEVAAIKDRIALMEERLAVRRAALQEEFIAADLAISRLNDQMASLSALGSQYRRF
jgi:flagellar hook-associated protein 2